jgi:tellurite resistance protein TerC
VNDLLLVGAVGGIVVALLIVDLKVFAPDREPRFRESVVWSLGWFGIGLGTALVVWAIRGEDDAVLYTTVYLIERTLSLDNLFVFLLLFSYFAIPPAQRTWLLFWGIVAAIALRGLAILGGVALVERFHFVIYVLGIALLVLAYRLLSSGELAPDPGRNRIVLFVRRLFPVAEQERSRRLFVRIGGRLHATPLFLCLTAIVFTDVAFAIDSIPAAFGITRDALLIWLANAMALLGLRALYVLVEGMIRRFRYLDETLAIVLGVVAVKLLTEDLYKVGSEVSLAIVVLLFSAGIALSLLAERRESADRNAPG